MLKILALICPIAMSPADCTPETATQVLRAPMQAQGLAMCGFGAQAFVASLSIRPRPGIEYQKTICVHVREREAEAQPEGSAK